MVGRNASYGSSALPLYSVDALVELVALGNTLRGKNLVCRTGQIRSPGSVSVMAVSSKTLQQPTWEEFLLIFLFVSLVYIGIYITDSGVPWCFDGRNPNICAEGVVEWIHSQVGS